MKGYEIRFKVFAESQEEADMTSAALRAFVDSKARLGIAVTAKKIYDALERWENSYIVNNFLK